MQRVFGEDSAHYKNFQQAYGTGGLRSDDVDRLKGVFLAAKSDYEGGYLFSLQKEISGELFGDFVALARKALDEEQKDVAAVLACAALEDTLK